MIQVVEFDTTGTYRILLIVHVLLVGIFQGNAYALESSWNLELAPTSYMLLY